MQPEEKKVSRRRSEPQHQTMRSAKAKDLSAASDRRAQIVTIAAEIFATKGYANSTVRDIGDAAGILSGSLYHHFSSKEAILEEILSGVLDELVERYSDVASRGLEARETLRELITAGLRFVTEQPSAATILQNDFTYLRQIARFSFVNDKNRQVRDIWHSALKRGVSEGGYVDTANIDLVYRSVMGTILSTVRWFDATGTQTVKDVAEGLTVLFLDGLAPR
jgi:AcrR family transcriptional regulator